MEKHVIVYNPMAAEKRDMYEASAAQLSYDKQKDTSDEPSELWDILNVENVRFSDDRWQTSHQLKLAHCKYNYDDCLCMAALWDCDDFTYNNCMVMRQVVVHSPVFLARVTIARLQ